MHTRKYLAVSAGLNRVVSVRTSHLAVDGGFAQVTPDGTVLILADAAQSAATLVEETIETAKARAQHALQNMVFADDAAFAEALAGVDRELAKLRVLHKHRSHGGPRILQ